MNSARQSSRGDRVLKFDGGTGKERASFVVGCNCVWPF